MLRALLGLLRRSPRSPLDSSGHDLGDLGRLGEDVAARYLRRRGLKLVARNVRRGRGEIDLVALEGSTLVFVEVKSRTVREGSEITGMERIDSRKRSALKRACALYRKGASRPVESYRLDVVTVGFGERQRVKEVRWYPAVVDLDPL